MPEPRIIHLTGDQVAYAKKVGNDRHAQGGKDGIVRELESGKDPLTNDIMGAMAEVAVCLHYGEDYYEWVYADPEAPPDLQHLGKTVSVKSTHHWTPSAHLIVPHYDTHHDVYMLVSVDEDLKGRCGLRGWLYQRELLEYPVFTPKDKGHPDYPPYPTSESRPCRHIPAYKLRPCKASKFRGPVTMRQPGLFSLPPMYGE